MATDALRPAGALDTTSAAAATVSCVMTVFNSRAYLRETLDSVLAQSFSNFEFVIIDDGSTDGSTEILRNYAGHDSRIRLTSRPNTGIVTAANEGLSQARGEFLARIDSDDVAEPTRFEKQVAYLRAHPDCVAVGSRLLLIDPYGSPLEVTDHKLSHEEIESELLSGSGWAISQPSIMMRRAIVVELGGYRRQFEASEDLDLSLRLAERGRLANLPEPLLKWRRHLGSVNHTRADRQDRNADQIIRETLARRGLPVPAQLNLKRWRPLPHDEQIRQWGWKALQNGNVPVARKHAVSCMKLKPLSKESWRLMYCAIRGH